MSREHHWIFGWHVVRWSCKDQNQGAVAEEKQRKSAVPDQANCAGVTCKATDAGSQQCQQHKIAERCINSRESLDRTSRIQNWQGHKECTSERPMLHPPGSRSCRAPAAAKVSSQLQQRQAGGEQSLGQLGMPTRLQHKDNSQVLTMQSDSTTDNATHVQHSRGTNSHGWRTHHSLPHQVQRCRSRRPGNTPAPQGCSCTARCTKRTSAS